MDKMNFFKHLILSGFIVFSLIGCSTNSSNAAKAEEPEVMELEENEDGEYDIIVFDTQYDTFLVSRAKPKNFYSLEYYRSRNLVYVTNWNSRVLNPAYDRNLYEVLIDYNQSIDYGLNLEYKLFNFFQFIEWKYNVDIDGRPNRF